MWKYRTDFVELNAEQRSPEWFRAREFRITASIYESILGHSSFTSKEETIHRLLGLIPNKVQNEAMRLGQENEGPLRDYYSKLTNCTITEPSLCLSLKKYDFSLEWHQGKMLSEIYPDQLADPLHPNWFIGGSPDGEIYPPGSPVPLLNLEIKYTKNLYGPLVEMSDQIRQGTVTVQSRYIDHYDPELAKVFLPDTRRQGFPCGAIDYFPHIWQSHFMQMQGCMAILNRRACVYLVGSPQGTYSEIIPFDDRYWRYFLYPSLVRAVELDLKPAMSKEQLTNFSLEVQKIIDMIKTNS